MVRRDGARPAAAAANLAENSPKLAWALRRPIKRATATSQNRVEPPLPSTTSYPSGRSNSSPVRPSDLADQPPDRCLSVRGAQQGRPVAASASRASGRTLAGPEPKRPSPGSRSGGISRCFGGQSRRHSPSLGRRTGGRRVRGCETGGMPVSDLSGERIDYSGDHLLESDVPAEPYALFRRWLDEAFVARDRGELAEPTAMVVATCVDGRPRARDGAAQGAHARRVRLLHQLPLGQGLQLSADPAVALHFGWHAIQRQIRVEGTAEKVTRAESEAYFATRPRGSQLGAWASAQSSRWLAGGAAGRLRSRRAAVRRTGRALPRALGRLPGATGRDRVLAGPAEPDARSPGLPARR